jgi:hypothetical protein
MVLGNPGEDVIREDTRRDAKKRRQKTEDRRRKTEDRRQMTE